MDPYPPGSARKHSTTGAVAIRTALPAPRAWFVFDLEQGGSYADEAAVATGDWVELVEVATT